MRRFPGSLIVTISVVVGSVITPPLAGQSDTLPVYGPADLHLDASRLQPHRFLYDPLDAAPGSEPAFADGVFKRPQIAILLDRTLYYDADDRPRDAIRVRWVSNAHPHTDELVVDARTLATVNERTRAGRNWETKDEILYVRGDSARVLTVSDDSLPVLTAFPLQYSAHYGVMILPFLFASMDVPDGSRFRLPAIGSDGEVFIEVEVHGPADFVNATNERQTALHVTSRHGWGEIEWYVSPGEMPYHQQAVWRFGGADAPTSVSKVLDWVAFDADVFTDVIDAEALRRQIGR